MTYKTVTNGYDWGPAIDKIILDLEVIIESRVVTKEAFKVIVRRIFDEVQETQREVINAYTSDELGNVSNDSQYITLELEVGPTRTEGSPFNYNRLTGRNEYIQTSYEISISKETLVSNVIDTSVATALMDNPTIKAFAGDIKPLCDRFKHNQAFEVDHVKLSYAYFEPNHKKPTHLDQNIDSITEAKVPLIIWLHGAGEGGKDTSIAVLGNKVTYLIQPEIQALFGNEGAYVLVPQVPTMWMDYNGKSVYNNTVLNSDGHSHYTIALKTLCDHFLAEHLDIDTDRIYIGGCSNGGYMTVKMLVEYPDLFAAAYPTCEVYETEWLTDERVAKIKNIPLWLVHSQDDPVVRISEFDMTCGIPIIDEKGHFIPTDTYSNALYQRLKNSGNKKIYYNQYDQVIDPSGKYLTPDGEPYKYHGHWSWVYTLSNTCSQIIDGKTIYLFEWLAQQKK